MAHAQKPDFVFRRNRRVHLNRQGNKFTRLLAGELCTSSCRVCTARASLCSAVMWRLLVTHSILLFPLHFSTLRHRVPSHFKGSLPAANVRGVPLLSRLCGYLLYFGCPVFVSSLEHRLIHCVVCLAKGPQPLPELVFHRVRSSASSFKFQYLPCP
jgi:hypothetical protein